MGRTARGLRRRGCRPVGEPLEERLLLTGASWDLKPGPHPPVVQAPPPTPAVTTLKGAYVKATYDLKVGKVV